MQLERTEDRIEFPPFALLPRARQLTLHGKPVKIGARALDILVVLARRSGELVSKAALMDAVWPQQQIDESALRVHLSALRRVLGLAPGSAPSIVNETGRGYRFVIRHHDQDHGADHRASHDTDAAHPSPIAQERPVAIALPRPSGRIFGRDALLSTLRRDMQGRRFATIAGPGGVGKTVLALLLARDLAEKPERPAFFLDLASLAAGAPLPEALFRALGLAPLAGAEIAARASEMPLGGFVLVLDNCEHLLNASATLAEQLLQAVPDLTLIATSREPLRAADEWIVRVPPLPLPPAEREADLTLADAPRFAALQVFLDRAPACAPRGPFSDADMPTIAAICRRLDGLPLAIEMAAAQLDSLSLADIASHLQDRFLSLCCGRRTAPPRQQSLRASFDWSHGLLTPRESRVLQRLSASEGRFSLKTAITLAADERESAEEVVDAVSALVAKSMILLDYLAAPDNYRMLNCFRYHRLAASEANGCETLHGRTQAEKKPLGFITFPGMQDVIRIDRIHGARSRS